MSTKYTLRFTATDNPSINEAQLNKDEFEIEPYTSNGPKYPSTTVPGEPAGGLHEKAVNAETSLVILGRGFAEYGDDVQQNMLYLLENFANTSPPVHPTIGQLWYELPTTTNPLPKLNIWTGNTWLSLLTTDGGITMTNALDMGGFRIINVGSPVNINDAVTISYANANYLSSSGNITLTGRLTLAQDPITALEAATKQYVDNTVDAHSYSKANSDSRYVNVSGDTMTGALTLSGSPTNALHAATKQYVDSSISGATGSYYTAAQVDANFVHITGDTITGFLTLHANPTNNLHAATKQYVDSVKTYADSAFIPFTGGVMTGTLILSAHPTSGSPDLQAATKKYVLDQLTSGAGGDGVLTAVYFSAPAATSTTLNFDVTMPDSSITTYSATNISRVGHTQAATTITYDNTSTPELPADVQGAIYGLRTAKADISSPVFTDSVTLPGNPTLNLQAVPKQYADSITGTKTRIFRSIVSPAAPGNFTLPHGSYIVGLNKLWIFNVSTGAKLFPTTAGNIIYNFTPGLLGTNEDTTLSSISDYDFNISVDGGPTTLVTLNGVDAQNYNQLLAEINDAFLVAGVANAEAIIDNTGTLLSIVSNTTGPASSIVITDDQTTAAQFLFRPEGPLLNGLLSESVTPGSPGVSGRTSFTFSSGYWPLATIATGMISADTYAFNLKVDTGPVVEIGLTGANIEFYDTLLAEIIAAIDAEGTYQVGVDLNVTLISGNTVLRFQSTTTGVNSAIGITSTGSNYAFNLTYPPYINGLEGIFSASNGATGSYTEVGTYGEMSDVINFSSAGTYEVHIFG
jgi:hypothetical protein